MANKKRTTFTVILVTIAIIILGLLAWLLKTKIIDKDVKESVPSKEQITPVMYEVTKDGSKNKIYLFGSIHIANINDIEFPEYILNAFKESNYLACEIDIVEFQKNSKNLEEEVMKMLYSDGTTIKEHFTEASYNKIVNFLTKKEMYSPIYDFYKPYFFQSLMTLVMASDAKISSESGVDEYFIQKAKENNKNVLEVEGFEFQNNLLLSFDDHLYELYLIEAIDHYDEEVNSLKELYEAWKKGNIEDILKYSDDEMEIESNYSESEIKLIEDYNKKLIDDRNNTMTNKVEEYFNDDKDVFFMVGALHVIGDKGIAKELEQRGYTVKQITK